MLDLRKRVIVVLYFLLLWYANSPNRREEKSVCDTLGKLSMYKNYEYTVALTELWKVLRLPRLHESERESRGGR